MNPERIYQIIRRPHVSEKSAGHADKDNQITFEVAKNATKPEIKAAVEAMFDVKVADVKTIVVKGKKKRFGRVEGKRSDWKKAMVRFTRRSRY